MAVEEKLMMTAIDTSHYFENEDGFWFAVDAGNVEAVRVLIARQTADKVQPNISLWWTGSATPGVVGAWVTDTIKIIGREVHSLVDGRSIRPTAECRLTIWSDEATQDDVAYRAEAIDEIADDLKKWAKDGAIGCSIISTAPEPHQVVYMWAALKQQAIQRESGEVGIQYAANAIATKPGQHVFSTLLHNTAARNLSDDTIDVICEYLAARVASFITQSA
jgi:hypothetical protein